jgi:hypothetical protein
MSQKNSGRLLRCDRSTPHRQNSNVNEVRILFLTSGAEVTPAQGSVKPTAGFTYSQFFFPQNL